MNVHSACLQFSDGQWPLAPLFITTFYFTRVRAKRNRGKYLSFTVYECSTHYKDTMKSLSNGKIPVIKP